MTIRFDRVAAPKPTNGFNSPDLKPEGQFYELWNPEGKGYWKNFLT